MSTVVRRVMNFVVDGGGVDPVTVKVVVRVVDGFSGSDRFVNKPPGPATPVVSGG